MLVMSGAIIWVTLHVVDNFFWDSPTPNGQTLLYVIHFTSNRGQTHPNVTSWLSFTTKLCTTHRPWSRPVNKGVKRNACKKSTPKWRNSLYTIKYRNKKTFDLWPKLIQTSAEFQAFPDSFLSLRSWLWHSPHQINRGLVTPFLFLP